MKNVKQQLNEEFGPRLIVESDNEDRATTGNKDILSRLNENSALKSYKGGSGKSNTDQKASAMGIGTVSPQ